LKLAAGSGWLFRTTCDYALPEHSIVTRAANEVDCHKSVDHEGRMLNGNNPIFPLFSSIFNRKKSGQLLSLRKAASPLKLYGAEYSDTNGKIDHAEWPADLKKVISEAFAAHLDMLLELHVVPPGRVVAIGPWDFYELFTVQAHSDDPQASQIYINITNRKSFAAYMRKAAVPAHRAWMFGWLQESVAGLRVVGSVAGAGGTDASGTETNKDYRERILGRKEWDCDRFCNKMAFAVMASSTQNCSNPSAAQTNECCNARTIPTHPEVFILNSIMLKGDLTENCFAGRIGDGPFHSLAVDFDDLYYSVENRLNHMGYNTADRWLQCIFYPRSLRAHFIERVDVIRSDHFGTKSPVFTAIIEAMMSEIESNSGQDARRVVEIYMHHIAVDSRQREHAHDLGANQGHFFWGERPSDMKKVKSPVDQQVQTLYTLFKSCNHDTI
jgi:hypothetical protein